MRLANLCCCGLTAGVLANAATAQSLADGLRIRLGTAHSLATWYALRDYRPAWVTDGGPHPGATELIRVLAGAAADGLQPADYQPEAIQHLLGAARTAGELADLELLLSQAFLRYGSDLARGRVAPPSADTLWSAAADSPGVVVALDAAIATGWVAEALHALRPAHDGYALLRILLGWYRAIAARGGWGTVPVGAALERGSRGGGRGDAVRRLRVRLIASGELPADPDSTADLFDAALDDAVRRFQRRHGLEADGTVGPETRAALNVPVEERIRQIDLNLERWRWLPRDLGRRYLMVNIPAFRLDVIDEGRSILSMPVIVGRPDWQTPIVSATLTGLVFGPSWNVPRSIAVEEMLPLLRRDPAALTRRRIHLYDDSTSRRVELDPLAIDWAAVSENTFSYRLVQDPGPGNPLGGVKLVFPNRFDVAAHDTPDRGLFATPVRTFSHGCVRVANAAELATYLMQDAAWAADSVRVAMARPDERWVPLAQPLPVHLVYWTAWVDEDGAVQFRPDVYGWDARLAEAIAVRRR